MKIGNFEFNFGRVVNVDKKIEQDSRVLTKLVRTQLVRSRSQVKDLTTATTSAESLLLPNRKELIRIYNNIVTDPHLSAVMLTLKLKVLNAPLKVYSGEKVDEKATDLIRANWFREILESFIDSEFYGYSLLQMDEIVSDRVLVTPIPREYVIPERRIVKKQVENIKDVISIDDPVYSDWLIFSNSKHLGLLHKAAPMVIMKRAVVSAWSEYAEVFGSPIRIGKTDIRDPKKYANMDAMLANMGSMAYGIFDPSDMIEFVETSKGDAFNVYNEFAKMADAQISKLFLGQTGTTDEKSFSGSANVHSGILDSIVDSYVDKMIGFVNEIVIPLLAKQKIFAPTNVMKLQGENNVAKALSTISPLVANKILESMKPNEIRDLIGLPPDDSIVAPIKTAQQTPSVMNKVAELYAELLHDHDNHNH